MLILVRPQTIFAIFALFVGCTHALVPWPTSYKILSSDYAVLNVDELNYENDYPSCFTLTNAVKRLYENFRITYPTIDIHETNAKIDKLTIKFPVPEDCNEQVRPMYPHTAMKEAYELTIKDNEISLRANELWGALRGLETLKQLVVQKNRQLFLPFVQIQDNPRFVHRGYLIDTSRHFITKQSIYQFLDAMAATKMNVLHWHIVDDQSFPYDSFTFPHLAKEGAFENPSLRKVYTQLDVADVIEYARQRGIRVMPEFDTPGHSQSWGKGLPNFLTECYSGSRPNGYFGPVDPTNDTNYDVLKDFFNEVAVVFPEENIHLGGDEVSFDCWQSNPNVNAFMKEKKIESYEALESYYIGRLNEVVRSSLLLKSKMESGKVKTLIYWEEVFYNKAVADKDVVIHVWRGGGAFGPKLSEITKAGFKVLLSSPWYLDYSYGNEDWNGFYQVDPLKFEGTEEQKAMVMGGEACIWGEYVDDTNLMQKSWPRGAAIAERLWSDEKVRDSGNFRGRLLQLTCYLQALGLKTEPITGPGNCFGLL